MGLIGSFIIENIHSYDVASFLDELKIAVRVGHHCAQPLMNLLNVNSTIRASIAPYNTIEEIDRLVEGLNIVYKFFIRN